MHTNRRIVAFLILALYVAQVLSGRALHLWLCSDGGGCGAHDWTSWILSHQHHHCHCHHHPGNGIEQQRRHEDSPNNDERHDSSTCWVCQVLGQAQDKPIELESTISFAVSLAVVVVLPDSYPSPSHSGFHSRAPPTLLV